jgi:phosphoglycerate dehydrogenase-like enzyme
MIRVTKSIANRRMYHAGSKAMARVLLTDGVDDCCVSLFKEQGHTVDFLKTMPEAELIKIIGDYDGLVRVGVRVRARVRVRFTVIVRVRVTVRVRFLLLLLLLLALI